jgi:DNA-binding MarR family transcriptional regulator
MEHSKNKITIKELSSAKLRRNFGEIPIAKAISIAKSLPKSAQIIFLKLVENGPQKSRELSENTALSPRTVRYGLEILRAQELVKRIPDFNDLRSHYYGIQTAIMES